jgi:uncharacterized membrane protein YfcA
MADINIWALAITGFFAGLLGALLGIGGGVLMVPVLTLAMGFPMQVAAGSSLVSIVINACTATSVYIRTHLTNLKLGLLLGITLVPGAVFGGILAAVLPSSTLSIIFAALLLYVAYSIIPKNPRKSAATTIPLESRQIEEKDHHTSHKWLDGTYHDPAENMDISYHVTRPVTGLVTSFFGGVSSSLLGVGGGLINVPVMNLIMKVPIKASIATSSLLLCITTMTGSLIYAHNGYVYPYIVAPLIPGIYLGARLGAILTQRSRSVWLLRIFAVFMLITAALMILKALNILGK